MESYIHTQKSRIFLYIFFFLIFLLSFTAWQVEFPIFLMFIWIFILGIVYSFSHLTVSLDDIYLKIKFGCGIYKKNFILQDIISVQQVRNKWYYGWGIRVWFWPYMLIFNVDGFDAVEIVMKNKKIYRIGSNDVKNLEEAILQKLSEK